MFLTKICRDVTATRPRLQHEGASTSVETAEGELLGIAPSAHNSSEIDYYYFGLVAITECAGIFYGKRMGRAQFTYLEFEVR